MRLVRYLYFPLSSIFTGFSVISEVIQEELGTSTSHTTGSTAELLRPVPRARLPWEGERPRPPPQADSSSTTAGPPSTLHTSSSYSEVSRIVNTLNPKDDATLTSSNTDPGDPTVTAKPKPSIVVPSGSSTEPSHSPAKSPSPPLHTPPLSPLHQHQLLSSPLHHSTPHVTTRSRVFRDKAPEARQHPQVRWYTVYSSKGNVVCSVLLRYTMWSAVLSCAL